MRRAAVVIAILAVATARATAAPEDKNDGDGADETRDAATDTTAAIPADDPQEPQLIAPSRTSSPGVARPRPRDDRWPGHRHQVGLSLQSGVGVRVVKPYDGEYCGERGTDGAANAPACLGRTPAGLDVALSWGLSTQVELLIEAHLAFERDFGSTAVSGSGPRPRRIAPGARFYFGESGRASFFSTLQAVLDPTPYRRAIGSERGVDLGLRNVNGFQLDLHPAYGLYVFLSETAGFRRWLGAELELGLGIQGRYP